MTQISASTPGAQAAQFRAVVVQRSSSGGGQFVHVVRVYLALVPVQDGQAVVPKIMTQSHDWVRVSENARAVRRMRALHAQAEQLAAKVNAGEISFDEAKTRFAN